MTLVYVAVGSNIDPTKNLLVGLIELQKYCVVKKVSSHYVSSPVGGRDQPDFINGVWLVEVENFNPIEFKYGVLRKVEESVGRVRSDDKYASREIDLDIILANGFVMSIEGFQIPDPDILDRNFIALPLYDLNPHLVIEHFNKSIKEIVMSMSCDDLKKDEKLTNLLKENIQ